jgi:hypothetical protein
MLAVERRGHLEVEEADIGNVGNGWHVGHTEILRKCGTEVQVEVGLQMVLHLKLLDELEGTTKPRTADGAPSHLIGVGELAKHVLRRRGLVTQSSGRVCSWYVQMDMANVFFQAGLGCEPTLTPIAQRPIGDLGILGAGYIKLAADEAVAIMKTLDVSLQVGLLAEDLAAVVTCTKNVLAAILDKAGMLQFRVGFHVVSAGEDEVAKGTADVRLLHVLLQLLHGREAGAIRRVVFQVLVAFLTPKLDVGVLLLGVASEGGSSIETGYTALVLALEGGDLEVLCADVAL